MSSESAFHFYQSLYQTQEFYQNEAAFVNVIEKANKNSIRKIYTKLLPKIYIKQKKYYDKQLMLSLMPELKDDFFENYTIFKSTNTFSNVKGCNILPFARKEKDDKNMLNFMDAIPNNENEIICDLLTFSQIPSHFNFFLDEVEFQNFKCFIKATRCSPLFFKYMRVIFVHPSFVKFINFVFYPVLEEFWLNDKKLENPEEFISIIIKRWKENVFIVPFVIKNILEEFEDISNELLLNSFFLEFFKFPQKYFAAEFYKNIHDGFFDPIIDLLKDKINEFTSSIINSLRQNTNNFITSIMSKIYFRPIKVFDSFDDVSNYKSQNCFKKNFNFKDYKIFTYVIKNVSHETNSKDSSVELDKNLAYLKNILKESNELPKIDDVEFFNFFFKNQNENKVFIEKNLVNEGDITNYVDRAINFDGNNPYNISDDKFNIMTKEHNDKFKETSESFRINERIKFFDQSFKYISSFFKNCIESILISKIEIPFENIPLSYSKNIRTPKNIYKEIINHYLIYPKSLIEFYKKQKEIIYLKLINGNTIKKNDIMDYPIYHRVAKQIKFYEYLFQRPELKIYDDLFCKYLKKTFIHQETTNNKESYICNRIGKKDVYVLDFLSTFFKNCDPLQMIFELDMVFKKFLFSFSDIKENQIDDKDIFSFLMYYGSFNYLISLYCFLSEYLPEEIIYNLQLNSFYLKLVNFIKKSNFINNFNIDSLLRKNYIKIAIYGNKVSKNIFISKVTSISIDKVDELANMDVIKGSYEGEKFLIYNLDLEQNLNEIKFDLALCFVNNEKSQKQINLNFTQEYKQKTLFINPKDDPIKELYKAIRC